MKLSPSLFVLAASALQASALEYSDPTIGVILKTMGDTTMAEVDGSSVMPRRMLKSSGSDKELSVPTKQAQRKLNHPPQDLTCPSGQSPYYASIYQDEGDGDVDDVIYTGFELINGCTGGTLLSCYSDCAADEYGYIFISICVPDGLPLVLNAMGTGSFNVNVDHFGPNTGEVVASVTSVASGGLFPPYGGFGGYAIDDITAKLYLYTGGSGFETYTSQIVSALGYTSCDPFLGGDPHFKTYNGTRFDFHGQCDLTVVTSHDFADTGKHMAIHARTTARYEYSYIEAVAIKIGDDILEVGSYGEYFLNGVSAAMMPNTMDQYQVTHTAVNKKEHHFDIKLGESEHILIKSFKDLVSLTIPSASKAHFGGSRGIMGDFDSGLMLGRDGVEISDANTFGQEWQVHGDEKLFLTARHPQFPTTCELPKARTGRRLGEMVGITEETALLACKTAGRDDLEGCMYDVMAVGDLEMAQAGAF